MSWFVFTLRFRSVKTILGYFDQLNFTPNCHNYYIAVTHSIIVTTSHRPIQLVTANATARCSYAGLMCHISSRLYYWICKIQRSWWICYLLFTPKCSKAFSFRGWSPPPPLGALPPDPHYGLALAIPSHHSSPAPVATWRQHYPFASVEIKSWLRPWFQLSVHLSPTSCTYKRRSGWTSRGTHGECRRWVRAEWGGAWGGLSHLQPTKELGGASWALPVRSGAEPRPKTDFGIFWRPQNAHFCTNMTKSGAGGDNLH